jgi:riboflavin synthase
VLPKGFIAVDGCSLTVGEVDGRRFSVYLIPETLRVTVFGFKGVGDLVNIEVEAQTQAIVDTVERVIGQYLDTGMLKGSGSGSSGTQQLTEAAAATAAAAAMPGNS